MECITRGRLNSHARSEIVQAVHSKILNICKKPTMKQLRVIGVKIVEVIGIKDVLGTGSVSTRIYMHLIHICNKLLLH